MESRRGVRHLLDVVGLNMYCITLGPTRSLFPHTPLAGMHKHFSWPLQQLVLFDFWFAGLESADVGHGTVVVLLCKLL